MESFGLFGKLWKSMSCKLASEGESNNGMRQTGQVDDTYKPLENSYINSEQFKKIDETISNNNSN